MSEQKQKQFAIVPLEAIRDDRLGKMQLRVYIALRSMLDRDSDTLFVKREKIVERCGYKKEVVSRVTSQLEDLGWLIKIGRGGFSKPCEYRFTTPDLSAITVTSPVTVKPGKTIHNGNQIGNGNQTSHRNEGGAGQTDPEPSNDAPSSEPETVTDSVTVTNSVTVTEPLQKTVTDSVQKTVTESVTGNNQTISRPIPNHETSTTGSVIEFRDPQSRITMDLDWSPNDYIGQKLNSERAIPDFFQRDCLLGFTLHHNGKQDRQSAFEKRFVSWVIKDWERFRHEPDGASTPKPMRRDWEPDQQAVTILQNDGMDEIWIWKQLPEFRLYWIDCQQARDNWNHLFVNHCRYKHQKGDSEGAVDRLTDRKWATL
jgi:hypothetical protein